MESKHNKDNRYGDNNQLNKINNIEVQNYGKNRIENDIPYLLFYICALKIDNSGCLQNNYGKSEKSYKRVYRLI